MHQYYEAEVLTEYIIKGNSAILKCNVPSFVADFVKVEAWVSSEGLEFIAGSDFGILIYIYISTILDPNPFPHYGV